MAGTSRGEPPSLLLDQVKEALDQGSRLSGRMRFAACGIFSWHSVDRELETLALAPPQDDGC